MNIFGELTRAQLELKTSDPTPALPGMVYWRTDTSLFKVDTGSVIKTLVDTDSTQTLSNKTLASTNKYYIENVSVVPTAGTAGRIIFNTSANVMMFDDGSTFASFGATTPVVTGAVSVGTIDSVTAVANGAVITGGNLILQNATSTMPGLVSISSQVFQGGKTFNGKAVFKAGGASQVVTIENYSLNILEGDYLNFWDNTSAKRVGVFAPAAITANYDLKLPIDQGSANSVLFNDGAGNLSFLVATNSNTVSSLVRRDALGSFSATVITASLSGNVTGNVTGNVSGTAASITGSLSGDVTSTGMATSITAGAVTKAKQESMGSGGTSVAAGKIAISAIQSPSTSSTTPVDATGLSVTIVTTGRPVRVGLIGNSLTIANNTGGGSPLTAVGYFSIVRDAASINTSRILFHDSVGTTSASMLVPASSVDFVDIVAAGTYTYKLQHYVSSAACTASETSVYLYAYEI